MEPLVSIVISNFNDKKNLRECLGSLRHLRYSNFETIVVDCGSDDGSVEMISKEFPEVKLIKEKKMGIGEALNIGISKANGNLFLLELNSDDVVHPDFLVELVKTLMSSEEIGLVCGKRLVYGTNVIDSIGGKVSMLFGFASSLGSGKVDSNKFGYTREVDYAGVYLAKKEVLREVGPFDPSYYLYFEDTDFCYRAKSLKYKIVYVPTAILWHKGRSSTRRNKIRYHYYMRRNNYRFILKNSPPFSLLTSMIFQLALSFILLMYHANNRKKDHVLAEIEAISWNFLNLRSTLNARVVERQRIASSKGVLLGENQRRYLIGYILAANILIMAMIISQYFRYEMFGTSLLLGWDSPSYVWLAKMVIAKGPFYMVQAWSFPHLYTQLLALLGYINGNVLIVERIMPLIFGGILVCVNSELIFRITKNTHMAGLTAFLTVLSINTIRLYSDLHRNLAALSFSMLLFLKIPNLDVEKSYFNKKYLFLTSMLTLIAGTHFETFFILFFSLMLYGCLSRNLKKLLSLFLACAIPVAILVSLFPGYFSVYTATLIFIPSPQMTLNEIILWTGGSWLLLGFSIVAIYLFYHSIRRKDQLTLLVFSWCITTFLVAASVALKVIPFPNEFAIRALLLVPIPVLLALSTSVCNNLLKKDYLKWNKFSSRKDRLRWVSVRSLLLLFLVLTLIISSISVTLHYYDNYMTPYISRSSYQKIMAVKEFFAVRDLPIPVVVFYGDPAVWFITLYRNYIGMEMGEHFVYYGNVKNLFRFTSSEPLFSDTMLREKERYYSVLYFTELIGNWSGPPPPTYFHESHIRTLDDLMSYTIVIVTPELYNDKIPYCLKPYYVGDGIYVIPPNSQIDFTKVSHGPEITVTRDKTTHKINSTYLYIDPYNPSIVYLSVNASSGYISYNLTDISSNWTFTRIEQGGDPSYPEYNPMRVNGTKAIVGNDPADSTKNWSTPWQEQNGTFKLDTSSRKEGQASLKITGKTDSWGNLGVRYDLNGTWNLTGYSTIAVWAKSNQSAPFSISLMDANGNSRNFWSIKAEGGSATTSWKRFAVNLSDYTLQTDGFNISVVDRIDFYVWDSSAGKPISFWIDDLTVDTPLDLGKSIYKDRVPVNETVVIYFYSDTECGVEA